jgi:Uma2 family endonuclease
MSAILGMPPLLAPVPGPPPTILFCDDDALYEVVNGQHVEKPSMGIYATFVGSLLYLELGNFVRKQRLGNAVSEALFILDSVKNIRRRPDVAFVSAERWPLDRLIPESGDWEVVPDLAIEVVSPNDLFEKVAAKLDEYFHYGVRQVWLVVPGNRQIHVYSPGGSRIWNVGEELDGGAVLPAFRLAVAELFQQRAAPAQV